MFLIRELLGLQLVEIGNAFGGRDHSTVIHSLERVQAQLHKDPGFQTRRTTPTPQLRSTSTLNHSYHLYR